MEMRMMQPDRELPDVEAELSALCVVVCPKRKSRLMRVLAFFLGAKFSERFWTTIGPKRIWAPTTADLSDLRRYTGVLLHEIEHIKQARRWPVMFQISYLLLPVPVFFAWFRWYFERKAYLASLWYFREHVLGPESWGDPVTHNAIVAQEIDRIVNTLWSNYGWCWPKPWMRRYFLKHIGGV